MFSGDPKFWQSLKVTFLYVFVGVPLRLAFALLIALLLNRASRAVGLYRTVFYLPSIIGGSVAVSIMWRNLYGDEGIINLALNLSVWRASAGSPTRRPRSGCSSRCRSGSSVRRC